MDRLSPLVTLFAAAVLGFLAYEFGPGSMLDNTFLGIPFWVGLLALALGLAAVTVHQIRSLRHPR